MPTPTDQQAPETWTAQPDGSIYSSDGTVVVWPKTDAECGRKGDYYECHRFQAHSRVKVDPRRLALILAAPELLAALIDLRAQVSKFCEEEGEADFYTGRAIAAIALATQGQQHD